MRAILSIVLIKYLPIDQLMTEQEANGVFHQFASWNYFFPILGALIADVLLGKYRTILYLSMFYTVGCAVLAFDQSRTGIYWGLGLIAIGSGGIKPCVSTCLGDQYGDKNKGLIDKAMALFYQGINFGAFLSIVLVPILLGKFGPKIAFGVPAVGMFLATVVFWSGRNQYAHIPPKGLQFLRELKKELKPLTKLIGLFLFMAVFFSLYDQSGSEWVLQASKMDLNFLGMEWLPAQIQIINPLLIVVFAGAIENKVFPLLKKLHPSDLVRVAFGFFLTAGAFAVVTWIEARIESGAVLNIAWQLLAYAILTVGEIFAYMSVLQLSYRKAKPAMKSFVGAIFLLAVALGNQFTSGVNFVIQNDPPSFTPDKVGVYRLTLTASDSKMEKAHEVDVTVLSVDDFATYEAKATQKEKEEQLEPKKMFVSAGKMRVATPETLEVPLYGEVDAGDVDGDVSCGWEIIRVPEGSSLSVADIIGKDRRLAVFNPDIPGKYTFRFEAKVGTTKQSDTVDIFVADDNLPPEVSAGKPLTIKTGTTVTLNGGKTYDPNGDELSYEWKFVSIPDGSQLKDDDIVERTIVAKGSWLKGSYFYLFFTIFMLVVAIVFIPFARKVDLGPDYNQGKDQQAV